MSLLQGLLDRREVAVKHLSQNSIDDKEFIREVQCLMMAKHKNIVRILGFKTNGKVQWRVCHGRCMPKVALP